MPVQLRINEEDLLHALLMKSMLTPLFLGSCRLLQERSVMLPIGAGGAPGCSVESLVAGNEGACHADR